jgi:GNAT superfamily N-acetyltransferase
MIFEALHDSLKRNELILVEGGYCRFHQKKNGSIVIYELMVLPHYRNKGIATSILEHLKALNPTYIEAKCPEDLPANTWYKNRGFKADSLYVTSSSRTLIVWKMKLN